MLHELMDTLTVAQRKEILARVLAFPYCGFGTCITGNICYYYKSFVGRDFKSWMQMAIFIVSLYLLESQTTCWYLLLKYANVFKFVINYTIEDFPCCILSSIIC